jgi:hypothetical protein
VGPIPLPLRHRQRHRQPLFHRDHQPPGHGVIRASASIPPSWRMTSRPATWSGAARA